MKYPDTVQLATTTLDGYGDRTVTVLTECGANFIRRKGVARDSNADGIVSDATVYLDPKNAVVTAKIDELEGMYIKYRNEWYSVSQATVAERKLLDNTIDNIHCSLQKEAGAPYVTYVS